MRSNMSRFSEFENKTINWVESLRAKNTRYGRYKMSKSTGYSPFTSCFACFIRYLLGDLEAISQKEKNEWIDYLLSFQDSSTGLFIFRLYEQKENEHDQFYKDLQLTTFCISALDALGSELRYPLSFLNIKKFNNPNNLVKWLVNQKWKDPWYVGNIVMFVQIMILYVLIRYQKFEFKESSKAFFDWHDKQQNPETGFWGKGRAAKDYYGLFGAYHQYILYFFVGRELQYKEQIIDKALSFQNLDGLFAPEMGGGACEDIDVIDTLVQLSFRTDYRKNEILNCLRHAYNSICRLRDPGGGYPWGIRRRYPLSTGLKIIGNIFRPNSSLYHWYFLNKRYWKEQLFVRSSRLAHGWTDNPIPYSESDLFSTSIRLHTIAIISKLLPDLPEGRQDYYFLKTPGLGWFQHV